MYKLVRIRFQFTNYNSLSCIKLKAVLFVEIPKLIDIALLAILSFNQFTFTNTTTVSVNYII